MVDTNEHTQMVGSCLFIQCSVIDAVFVDCGDGRFMASLGVMRMEMGVGMVAWELDGGGGYVCWCWKENDICTASLAMAISIGNLREPDIDNRSGVMYVALCQISPSSRSVCFDVMQSGCPGEGQS